MIQYASGGPSFPHTVPSPIYQAAQVRDGMCDPTRPGHADPTEQLPGARGGSRDRAGRCKEQVGVFWGSLFPFASSGESGTSIVSNSQNG